MRRSFARSMTALAAVAFCPSSAAAQQPVVVFGSAVWMDERGNPQPIRHAQVQVWNARTGQPLGTPDTTDSLGAFTLPIPAPADPVFVRVHALAPDVRVQRPSDKRDHFYDGVARAPTNLAAPDTLRVPRAAEANGAFSILDAITRGVMYLDSLPPKARGPVVVRYPGKRTGYDWSDGSIHIGATDPWDWDVVLHEYGHAVAGRLGVDLNVGGVHEPGNNLAKDSAKPLSMLSLAWGEGLATFFAVRAQRVLGLSRLGLPRVGDARYTDPEIGEADWALDSQDVHKALGEDNEVAVSRILYDLVDEVDPAAGDAVSMGDGTLWKRLEAGPAFALPAAWNTLTLKSSVLEKAAVGGVFGVHGAAARPTAPADGQAPGAAAPEFRWAHPTGYPPHDRYALEILRQDGTSVWCSAHQPGEPVFLTPTKEVWHTVLAAGLPLAWVVHSWRAAAPMTVYTSGARILGPAAPPVPSPPQGHAGSDDAAARPPAAPPASAATEGGGRRAGATPSAAPVAPSSPRPGGGRGCGPAPP
ncbi:MAG TPA: hypothetical protein VHG93_20045 [Longimicrobium sp.]|nr:hypothetical protein [Longimicrobium sp.]